MAKCGQNDTRVQVVKRKEVQLNLEFKKLNNQLKMTRISRLRWIKLVLLILYCASLACSGVTCQKTKSPVIMSSVGGGGGQNNSSKNDHHSNRLAPPPAPLERPSLNLVEKKLKLNDTPTLFPEGPMDWFVMGGAAAKGDDLVSDEARHSGTQFISNDEQQQQQKSKLPRRIISSTRRMAEIKHRKSSGKQQQQQSINKTSIAFDDDSSSDASESQSSSSSSANDIYDDPDENASSMAGTQKEPECASSNGRYYCTFKEDYPLKLVTEVTKYYKWPLEKLFRDLHAQIMPKLAQDSTGNLVCDSVTRVVRPGWARNTNERWLVVINTDNYHQYVTEVVCQYGTNSRCNFIPPCYYSSCQQRYNTQKLLVIDPTNPYRGPFLSEFLFPSCCVCYVPSTSSSEFQSSDKYRPSPATIYQRTMQQEAANNLNPPQFKPPGMSLLEEAFSSAAAGVAGVGVAVESRVNGQLPSPGANGPIGASAIAGSKATPSQQPPGPGEIRRAGELQPRRSPHEMTNDETARHPRQLEPATGSCPSCSSRHDNYHHHHHQLDTTFPRLGLDVDGSLISGTGSGQKE